MTNEKAKELDNRLGELLETAESIYSCTRLCSDYKSREVAQLMTLVCDKAQAARLVIQGQDGGGYDCPEATTKESS